MVLISKADDIPTGRAHGTVHSLLPLYKAHSPVTVMLYLTMLGADGTLASSF